MQPNRVARILGIEKPVVQGPLSWLTDARLVAAVGNAGGLGVLGPNAGLTATTAVSTPGGHRRENARRDPQNQTADGETLWRQPDPDGGK
ncbi:hypothetical protein TUM9839_23680 [Klebsiella pneumoniae subsp. pneumoniae]|nr:hypothetical protein TUM9839_23680 [Klebsiella pneumoniae subsp. pneumoniae]